MQLDLSRTIVAVSSPWASAQRAIVRLSGPSTIQILQSVLDSDADKARIEMGRRKVAHQFETKMRLNWDGRRLPVSIYLWPNSHSFTGEPCAEVHLLGSLPLVERVVRCLIEVGASPAERGEFALRSFLAGKIDLVQAEAILGVIESTEVDQLQWALGQLGGNISGPVRTLRAELMEMLAHLEAGLDFVEEDIEFITNAQLLEQLEGISDRVEKLSDQLRSRGTGNRQIEIALVGLPNAGKSSLFNTLAGNSRAIVSPIAGTTRDIVSVNLNLSGVSATLLDTAGMEQIADHTPRAAAQSILRDRLQTCDMVLLCQDLSAGLVTSSDLESSLLLNSLLVNIQRQGMHVIRVGTKADLLTQDDTDQTCKVALHDYPNAETSQKTCQPDVSVSIHDPESLEQLKKIISRRISTYEDRQFTQATHHTAVRCYDALQRASQSLLRARELIELNAGEELIASELHCSTDDLSSIIGEVHNDDILGEIFSRFCIGK